MKISVSLNSFYFWHRVLDVKSQLKSLALLKDIGVDGVELHLTGQEVLDKEYKKFVGKVDDYFVTVHLRLLKNSKKLCSNLRELVNLLNVHNLVVHADVWDSGFPEDIPFVLENSDKNKADFKSLKEVSELKRGICLDINHLEQTMPGKMKEQIKFVKGRIKEVHVSCLENSLYDKLAYIEITHCLISGSDYKIPDCVPHNVLWVIEGVIPKDRLDLLEKEIEVLRNL